MAATEQLARMTEVKRVECSVSETSLDKLISFSANFVVEYLDLDFMSMYLKESFFHAGYKEVSDAVIKSTEGEKILNPSFPNGPSSYILFCGEEIRYIPYVEIQKISKIFFPLRDYEFPEYEGYLKSLKKKGLRIPNQHPIEYWGKLVDFYSAAEKEVNDIVVWWD